MKTTFTNEYRKPTNASASVKDIIQHVKEAEARVEQLEQRNKALLNELTVEKLARKKAETQAEENARLYEAFAKGNRYARDLLTVKDKKISKLESQLSNATEKVARYKRLYQEEVAIGDELEYLLKKATSDIKLLTKLAKDLHARVQSWQRIAKNLFRKNKELEIEAICKECEMDEAYDRIRELEEEKQMLIDENKHLNDLLYSHREIIWRHEDVQEVAKQQPLLYDLSQQLQLAAEMSAYINYTDKMDIDFKDIKADILVLETKDELISTIGYVLDELSDLEFLLQAEQKADELEDRLDEIEDVCNRILYPFQLCE